MTTKTKTVIPCGKFLDAFWSTPDKQVVTRVCGEDGVYCEYCMIEYGKLYLAEADQTPADAEWLESVGVKGYHSTLRPIVGLQYMLASRGEIELCFSPNKFAVPVNLVHSPTRGAVLKIVSGIGGGDE